MPQQGADAPKAAGWHELPPELLAHVLGRLAQLDRLGGAAQACRAFAAAAAAATEHVQIAAVGRSMRVSVLRQRMHALWAWLEQHGGHVVSLVEQESATPFGSWLSWDVEREKDSGYSDEAAWPPAPPPPALPCLAVLRLLRCPLPWPAAALAALTALTELHVERRAPGSDGERLSAVLPQLSGLRRLRLTAALHDNGLAAAIAGLPQLQALWLDGPTCVDVCALPLPSGMTQLELRPGDTPLALSTQATPHVAALTALRDLRLRDGQLREPGMWGSGLVGLMRFELHGRNALPEDNGAPRATAKLLRLLGQQTALAHLHIVDALQHQLAAGDDDDSEGVEGDEGLVGGGSPLYAHLVRSSLTHLVLAGSHEDSGCLLPLDAGRLMFGQPGLLLRRLARLELAAGIYDKDWLHRDFRCISAADVARIVACCMDGCLAELRLVNVVHSRDGSTVDWGVLQPLTSLTKLSIGSVQRRVPCTGLPQLTQLRSLSLEGPAAFTDDVLFDVVQHLTRLSHIEFRTASLSEPLSDCVGDCFTRVDEDCDWWVITVVTDADRLGTPSPEHRGSVCEQLAAALREGGLWDGLAAQAQQRAALRQQLAMLSAGGPLAALLPFFFGQRQGV